MSDQRWPDAYFAEAEYYDELQRQGWIQLPIAPLVHDQRPEFERDYDELADALSAGDDGPDFAEDPIPPYPMTQVEYAAWLAGRSAHGRPDMHEREPEDMREARGGR